MLVCFFCCSGLEIVHNEAGDKVALAEATVEQAMLRCLGINLIN